MFRHCREHEGSEREQPRSLLYGGTGLDAGYEWGLDGFCIEVKLTLLLELRLQRQIPEA
jgi:hypothetical protein